MNDLTVIGREPNDKNRNSMWLCKCVCGNEIIVRGFTLRKKDIQSCGCKNREKLLLINTKHNGCGTKLYNVWLGMKNRCNNPNFVQYYLYGGRGIKVDKEWDDFANFRQWAIASGYTRGLSIDRIDVNENYSSNNCRWVSQKVQQNNKRTNKRITYNNETHSLMEWCDLLHLNYERVSSRLDYGWDFYNAITLPKNCRIKIDGIIPSEVNNNG